MDMVTKNRCIVAVVCSHLLLALLEAWVVEIATSVERLLVRHGSTLFDNNGSELIEFPLLFNLGHTHI